jgi:Flp pilus assembly protein TadG
VRTLNQNIGQEGVAMVEFAIIVPLLVILVFGIIDFGLIFYNKQVITNASREGARAMTTGELEPNVREIVKNYCGEYLINLGNDDIHAKPSDADINISGPDTDNDITVSVSYKHIYAFASIIGLDHTVINAQTVMKMEE